MSMYEKATESEAVKAILNSDQFGELFDRSTDLIDRLDNHFFAMVKEKFPQLSLDEQNAIYWRLRQRLAKENYHGHSAIVMWS